MDLAIIIVSWNTRQLLHDCLRSIGASLAESDRLGRGIDATTWVIDNGSADNTVEMVREQYPKVRPIANTANVGFAAGNNQGIEQAVNEAPRHLLLLNPDTVVRDRALETLVRFMDQFPDAGMAGARLVFGDDSFQHSGFGFPGLAQILIDLLPVPARLHESRLNGRYPRHQYLPTAEPFCIDHPLGAAMMVRRKVIDAVGLMDTSFHMYCEEVDWAMRVRKAGWQIYCVPAAEIVHFGGQSTSQVPIESFFNLWRSRHRLYRKHYTPTQVRLAGWLVGLVMRHRARQTDSDHRQEVFRQITRIWRQT